MRRKIRIFIIVIILVLSVSFIDIYANDTSSYSQFKKTNNQHMLLCKNYGEILIEGISFKLNKKFEKDDTSKVKIFIVEQNGLIVSKGKEITLSNGDYKIGLEEDNIRGIYDYTKQKHVDVKNNFILENDTVLYIEKTFRYSEKETPVHMQLQIKVDDVLVHTHHIGEILDFADGNYNYNVDLSEIKCKLPIILDEPYIFELEEVFNQGGHGGVENGLICGIMRIMGVYNTNLDLKSNEIKVKTEILGLPSESYSPNKITTIDETINVLNVDEEDVYISINEESSGHTWIPLNNKIQVPTKKGENLKLKHYMVNSNDYDPLTLLVVHLTKEGDILYFEDLKVDKDGYKTKAISNERFKPTSEMKNIVIEDFIQKPINIVRIEYEDLNKDLPIPNFLETLDKPGEIENPISPIDHKIININRIYEKIKDNTFKSGEMNISIGGEVIVIELMGNDSVDEIIEKVKTNSNNLSVEDVDISISFKSSSANKNNLEEIYEKIKDIKVVNISEFEIEKAVGEILKDEFPNISIEIEILDDNYYVIIKEENMSIRRLINVEGIDGIKPENPTAPIEDDIKAAIEIKEMLDDIKNIKLNEVSEDRVRDAVKAILGNRLDGFELDVDFKDDNFVVLIGCEKHNIEPVMQEIIVELNDYEKPETPEEPKEPEDPKEPENPMAPIEDKLKKAMEIKEMLEDIEGIKLNEVNETRVKDAIKAILGNRLDGFELNVQGEGEDYTISIGSKEYNIEPIEKEVVVELNDYEKPETPEEPEVPGETEKPNGPDEPEVPQEPQEPEVPGETEEPNGPDEPEAPQEPEEPEVPGETEEPNGPDEPEAPQEPEEPEVPGEIEKPETPERPEVPERPEYPNIDWNNNKEIDDLKDDIYNLEKELEREKDRRRDEYDRRRDRERDRDRIRDLEDKIDDLERRKYYSYDKDIINKIERRFLNPQIISLQNLGNPIYEDQYYNSLGYKSSNLRKMKINIDGFEQNIERNEIFSTRTINVLGLFEYDIFIPFKYIQGRLGELEKIIPIYDKDGMIISRNKDKNAYISLNSLINYNVEFSHYNLGEWTTIYLKVNNLV